MIEKVYLTECGYCVNNLGKMYKGYKKEKVNFPANCVIIKHSTKGWILFDTGYSQLIYTNGFIGKIYNRFNPTFVKEKDEIKNKLSKINVDCEEISYVVISHFHPDHIGCLRYFTNAKIVASLESIKEVKKNSIRSLIFKNMLIENIEEKAIIVENNYRPVKVSDKLEGYDMFGDGEITLVNLKGHSLGQIGMLLKRGDLFFVADSYWREDELKNDIKLKLIPKIVQSNYAHYEDTKKFLKDFITENPKIKLIASHEIVTDMEVQKYDREDFNLKKLC
ncbi:MAG: MBL fold metallo-hydrolase [Clostridiaceae bacterium]